ncbi:sigma-70 family RNA polymerase sigma factor [Actinomycetospora cinnamomea]|uniref:RNA polymerase sigma factor (Sigma-70 family) n=1 Tax=Actinomycetospora cinnamomea TaxID=663609 RepID=A0A2U1F7T2_9PSEU|nr:sigma-70 family RNA polymerase sigma factor [Actinomycetospora cinnamomea]PVZ08222.1 RNA polymerase sigma factor (sigma-70 family) [Actinomycetospora cinnamomea]
MSVDPSSHTSVIRSVTTRVAGRLATEAFAHHYGTPSQQIGVRAGDTLTYVTTGDAAAGIARAFTDALALAERQQLAWTASLTWLGIEPGTYPPTLLLRYDTPAASSVGYQPRREISGQIVPAHVWVRVGPVLWQICDRVAARRLAEVWTHCARLLTSPTAPPAPFLRPDDVEPAPQRSTPALSQPGTADAVAACHPSDLARRATTPTTGRVAASADDERGDRELLSAYAEHGDRGALAVLATRYHDVMVGAARRVLGARGEVDDAVQNAWIKVATKADTFRGDAAVGTWLYRIAHNAALDATRRAQSRPAELFGDPAQVATDMRRALDGPSEAPGTVEQMEATAVLDDLLAVLTPAQRAAVELVDLQGLDIGAAASRLEVAEGTLKSRRARARAAMGAAAAARGLRFPL